MSVSILSLQALLREKQKAEELEKTKEAIKQLIQDAAVRTRKEVQSYFFFYPLKGAAEWPSEQKLLGCFFRSCNSTDTP